MTIVEALSIFLTFCLVYGMMCIMLGAILNEHFNYIDSDDPDISVGSGSRGSDNRQNTDEGGK